MKIGIDIDDTICETNEKIIALALEFDKKFLLGKGFKNKDAYKFVDMMYWNMEDARAFFAFLAKQNVYDDLKEIENASYYINQLYEEGHEIIFITMRSAKFVTKRVTRDWLMKHGFKYHKLLFNVYKKGFICSQEKVDLFIDDVEMNIKSALSYSVDALLMDTPYNKKVKYQKRVTSWKEIYDYVNGVNIWEE